MAMKDLKVGQQVFAGYSNSAFLGGNEAPVYETVYGFGHRNQKMVSDYLRITTTSSSGKTKNRPLEISASHLIFVNGKTDPVRADSLRVGDELLHQSMDTSAATPARITKIEIVLRQGLYQPLTKDGTIVVDGLQASTYVSVADLSPRVVELGLNVFSEQSGFHLFMAPYHFVCTKISSELCVNDHSEEENGINYYLAFGKRLLGFGEMLPTWLMTILVTVVLLFCGIIKFLDCFLEGDARAVVSVLTGLTIYWILWCSERRTVEKSKVA
jgi:Hint module